MDELLDLIRKGDSAALAKGITLIESQAEKDWPLAKELLKKAQGFRARAKRLGVSGPPGAGKSTFIEALGLRWVSQNEKVAVLAIDPSSEISGGSILGDKTRMEELSRHPNAFIRPSASRGHLGGITSRLPGVLLLCEVAGFDRVIVESVGVGQSEVDLHHMVDQFILLAQPGSGDELQGIKKGILEYVDAIVVNKYDQDATLVNTSIQQLLATLKIMRGRQVPVKACSALTGYGMNEVLETIEKGFESWPQGQDPLYKNWFHSLLISEFKAKLYCHPRWKDKISHMDHQIQSQKISVVEAVEKIIEELLGE